MNKLLPSIRTISFKDKAVVDFAKALLHLSRSLDYNKRGLTVHHQRVALIALRIGQKMGLANTELFEIFRAAIIHDIGAVTWDEKSSLEVFEVENTREHCLKGHSFLQDLSFFHNTAEIILSHHDRWQGGNATGLSGAAIPRPSRIIHLADRVDVLIKDGECILTQSPMILERIGNLSGVVFDPEIAAILKEISDRESFWLDLVSPWLPEVLMQEVPVVYGQLNRVDLHDLGELYARAVDAKSVFTHLHSRGVAMVAQLLGELLGLTGEECYLLRLAGLLHDIGKLSVPDSILEKKSGLTSQEHSIIKQHAYYTYWWLKKLLPGSPLAQWASYHHEHLDGSGYPFHKTAAELDIPARVVAIADVYTALREARPYRKGLSQKDTEDLMLQFVKNKWLDGEIITLLFKHHDLLEERWQKLILRIG